MSPNHLFSVLALSLVTALSPVAAAAQSLEPNRASVMTVDQTRAAMSSAMSRVAKSFNAGESLIVQERLSENVVARRTSRRVAVGVGGEVVLHEDAAWCE